MHRINSKILLSQYASGCLVSSRLVAAPLREELEIAFAQQDAEATLDFTGITTTQSFVDELVGVLVLHHGPDVLARIIFKGCSDDVRAIIEFVVTDRCDQYIKQHSH